MSPIFTFLSPEPSDSIWFYAVCWLIWSGVISLYYALSIKCDLWVPKGTTQSPPKCIWKYYVNMVAILFRSQFVNRSPSNSNSCLARSTMKSLSCRSTLMSAEMWSCYWTDVRGVPSKYNKHIPLWENLHHLQDDSSIRKRYDSDVLVRKVQKVTWLIRLACVSQDSLINAQILVLHIYVNKQ